MSAENEIAAFGPYRLNAPARLLQRDGETVPLGGRAMDILIALVERVGEVVSRRDLMQRAWPESIVEEANLRVHIGGLRKALGEGESGARYVANIAGRGYCFVMPVYRYGIEAEVKSEKAPKIHTCSNNLPATLARMVGRDIAVRELSLLVRCRRAVSVVGVGGVGKTTLAVHVAHEMLKDFGESVYFVDLSTIEEPSQFKDAVAMSICSGSSPRESSTDLHALLAGRKVLLILDNCEHLIDLVASTVEQLYATLPSLHIMVTSREALRVEAEHVFMLPPLENPPLDLELTAARALEAPSVQLLMDRAEAGGYRLGLLDKDAPVAALLCDRLDGIPLALELAGGCVGTYGIPGTAELLDSRFKLLWRARRGAPARHRTLHAMVDWSYNLLSPQERCVFSRLSVFVGQFSLDAAQAVVCDDTVNPDAVAEAIASLADKSLLSVLTSRGVVVFRLLETTRAHAAGKLAESGDQHVVARRHLVHGSRATALRLAPGSLPCFPDGRSSLKSMGQVDDRYGFALTPADGGVSFASRPLRGIDPRRTADARLAYGSI